jgi:hypothetical protein
MPHFGLMEERSLGPVNGPLQRARLHLRGGKRRLRQGKISAGIVTLYDAMVAAMEFYVERNRERIPLSSDENPHNDKVMFRVLVRAGVLDRQFDFEGFDRLMERALHEDLSGYDYGGLVEGIDAVMFRLGVMPFSEESLPPEDPSTF